MGNKFSEELLKAVEIVADGAIQKVTKDKTILCTIEDNAHASEGKYTVSNSAARFDAFGRETDYRVGQNVWVLIPEGDYNNDKIIISKYTKDDASPYVWVDPMQSYVNITSNVIQNIGIDDDGLLANYDAPLDLITGDPISVDDDQSIADAIAEWFTDINNYQEIGSDDEDASAVAGLDRMGISAEFRTAFGSTPAISGNYGLAFQIITKTQIDTGTPGEDRYVDTYHNIPITFDTADMWGDPYNFTGYFKQSICADIDPALYGTPVMWAGVFYQNNNFIGEGVDDNGEPVLVPATYEDTSVTPPNIVVLDPNIFVRNISLSFGYSVDTVQDDAVFLFTEDSTTYVIDNSDGYSKTLQARYIYVGDDDFRIAINNVTDYWKYCMPTKRDGTDNPDAIQGLVDMHPILRYYQEDWSVGGTEGDLRAHNLHGGLWKEIYVADPAEDDNAFLLTVSDLQRNDEERFMCLVCCNNKYDEYANYSGDDEEENEKQWATSDQIIGNPNDRNIVVFRNKRYGFGDDMDFIRGLVLAPDKSDKSNGVFTIYEATLGANSKLVNAADEYKVHTMNLSFWSAITGQSELDTAERIAWYIPRNSTMIKEPKQDKLGEWHTILENANDIDNYVEKVATTHNVTNDNGSHFRPLSQEEIDLFNSRIDDYWIIIDTSIADPMRKEEETGQSLDATLNYYIKPNLMKQWTRNKILASIYRYKRTYEAEYELKFGAKGTNGTDYTLMLTMTSETTGDGRVISNPPAWTLPNTGVADKTMSMQLEAILFDKNDTVITSQGKSWTWSIYSPEIGLNGSSWTQDTYITNRTSATPTLASYPSRHGFILQCQVALSTASGTLKLTEYLIVPVRKRRDIIAMEGPTVIRYSSSGTNPEYYDCALGLLDEDEKIHYNTSGDSKRYTNVAVRTLYETLASGVDRPNPFYFDHTKVTSADGQTTDTYNAEGHVVANDNTNTPLTISYLHNYYPVCVTGKTDQLPHLQPKAMFFKDVNYHLYLWFQTANENEWAWSQPLLILMDPYGNKFLNNWGGELNIDPDNNSIMSAVMGAGKKDSNNRFTGILLGDLPKIDAGNNRTGMVGYHQGDLYYQLYDNGTMTLGKSSRAQLKFDGSNSTIKNAGYDSGTGILIDFEGSNGNQKPYIDMKANSGANFRQVKIGTSDPYFMIKVGTGADTDTELFHVGPNQFYLQTADYVANTSGARLDLKNANFISNGSLTIRGGTLGANNSIYFSTSNSPSVSINGTTLSTWRLLVGSQFGVTNSGKVYMSGASIGGSSVLDDNTVINGRSIGDLKAQADRAGADARTVINAAYVQELLKDKIGGWSIWHNTPQTVTTYTTNASGTVTASTSTTYSQIGSYYGLAHVDNNTLTHYMGTGLPITSYPFNSSTITATGNWTFYMNGNFGVTTSGILYAKGGYFDGTIYAAAGNIGGWQITTSDIHSSNATYSASRGMILQPAAGTWALAIGANNYSDHGNAPFRVDHEGNFYASKGTLSGSFEVPAANITGKLTANQIEASALTVTSIDASAITSGTIAAARINARALTIGAGQVDSYAETYVVENATLYRYDGYHTFQGTGGAVYKIFDGVYLHTVRHKVGMLVDSGEDTNASHTDYRKLVELSS